MYQLQAIPDKEAFLKSGVPVTPVSTLRDEYGGVTHIVVDDHCYVLLQGSDNEPLAGLVPVSHWYPEAVEAMRALPPIIYG